MYNAYVHMNSLFGAVLMCKKICEYLLLVMLFEIPGLRRVLVCKGWRPLLESAEKNHFLILGLKGLLKTRSTEREACVGSF